MLNPSKVCITGRGNSIFPTSVSTQQVTTPIAIIKRRIGYHIIYLYITVGIVQERTFRIPLHLRSIDATNGKIHLTKSPSGLIAFLSINGYIVNKTLMFLDKLFALNKHTSRTTTGVKHTSFIRFQHIDK